MRTVVLDTNVLIAHPGLLTSFPDAHVVVPDTVLSEIDKLKTARVDAELRYKGRAASRLLFDLAEKGSLHEGVALANGGRLSVVGLRSETDMPEGLSSRNADDRILAIALQTCTDGCDDLTLVTNDLNMLLKAQAHGIRVDRIEVDDSFSRRFIVRPFQRYKIPITILAVAIAVFAAVVGLIVYFPGARQSTGLAALPAEFVDQMPLEQQQALGYLIKIEANPDDAASQRALAILYDQMSESNATYLPLAIKHYEVVAKLTPADHDARTDLATAYFRAGRLETAIQQVTAVLRDAPDHVNANFNLGIFYMSTKPKKYQQAAAQFQKVIRLAKDEAGLAEAKSRAEEMLTKVIEEAKAAGQPVKTDGGTL